jgi:hypothetical protein
MSCVLVLLVAINVVVVVLLLLGHVLWGGMYASFYIQGGEIIRKVTESVII